MTVTKSWLVASVLKRRVASALALVQLRPLLRRWRGLSERLLTTSPFLVTSGQ